LDLNEKKSFVKWLLESGYDVFLVSWVNPDAQYHDISFFDYIDIGLEPALNFIQNNYKHKKFSMIGYCIGGTLLACLAAYYKKKDVDIISNLTFFTTLIDFSNAGIIKDLLDMKEVNDVIKKNGLYTGKEIYNNFASLRANDLYWPSYINNYLLGNKPNAFDVLFWNADSTNLPEKMSKFYLDNMYQKNNLIKGSLKIKNIPIDIESISVPCYFVATEEDHIAPWQAVYDGYKYFNCEKKFILAGSGHIAGIINHPDLKKYHYNDLNENEKIQGSWWLNWHEWNSKFSNKKIKPVSDEDCKVKVIDKAPGSYVMVKC
jgi:polyhydroxyalkanoate synthase